MKVPNFVNRDPEVIMSEIKTQAEVLFGRDIQPAQVEMLILQLIGFREVLLYERINAAMAQCLVQFSRAPILDYVAELVSVERLPSSHAGCVVRFTLVPGHGNVIPGGTRVMSGDGIIFETNDDVTVAAGIEEADVLVTAQVAGVAANGIETGKINVLLDKLAFLSDVSNITVTGGGSDVESDESLRERIKLAPNQFTTAGARNSYMYHAKSTSAAIIDVSVFSQHPVSGQYYTLPAGTLVARGADVENLDAALTITPGMVCIVPLAATGDYSAVLNAVYNVCSPETVRPLCDTVIVAQPEPVSYSIEVNVIMNSGGDANQLRTKIETALRDYADGITRSLGVSVVRTLIACICRIDGVFDVDIITPSENVTVLHNQYSECAGITVNITGIQ